MLGPFHNAPRAATAVTLALFALTALVAISTPGAAPRDAVESSCADGIATCSDGNTWEKLICDDAKKLTKCFDATTTCASWNVCDCCSPIPLHKCLSPLAGRAFGADCSSPIDAREQCCGNSETHVRGFQALADLQSNIQETESAVMESVSNGIGATEAAVSSGIDAAGDAVSSATQAVEGAVSSVTG